MLELNKNGKILLALNIMLHFFYNSAFIYFISFFLSIYTYVYINNNFKKYKIETSMKTKIKLLCKVFLIKILFGILLVTIVLGIIWIFYPDIFNFVETKDDYSSKVAFTSFSSIIYMIIDLVGEESILFSMYSLLFIFFSKFYTSKNKTLWVSWIISSIIFGLLHTSSKGLGSAIFTGILVIPQGLIIKETNNPILNLIFHILNNIIVILPMSYFM